ncbi:amidohydrolase family protein [Silvibacterium sp.]|uniref:amidohydrolase family protein n=1 Tax=Silvibacterium sp. TaxID=1964179 RepID=UPI0039E6D9BC
MMQLAPRALAAIAALFFCCLAARAQTQPLALTGTVITPQGPLKDATVLIEHGRITAVGQKIDVPANARRIDTKGIVSPGFVDLHNHLTWNVFPRWRPTQRFGARYDWQALPMYRTLMEAPHRALVDEGDECEMEWYAEVKAAAEGETSVVGGTKRDCGRRLLRNLDTPEFDARVKDQNPQTAGDASGATGSVIYNVFPFQMSEDDLGTAKTSLDHGGALLIHVAEGAPGDASAEREFQMLKGRGLLRTGVSVIHGAALTPDNFREMATAGVGLIWSPRSNIELYGGTADVAAAKAAGVTLAIAPDWSPTGSDGTLAELNFAAAWNMAQTTPVFTDRELVDMATSGAAALVGMSGHLGVLIPGAEGDVVVLRPHEEYPGKDAYWSIVHSDARDVQLVVSRGETIYGSPHLFSTQKHNGPTMNTATVCGEAVEVEPPGPSDGALSFGELETKLSVALNEWGRKLAPLAECGD